jgi:hypothetical protein
MIPIYADNRAKINIEVIYHLTFPIETHINFSEEYITYDCIVDNKYQKEIEKKINDLGFPTMFVEQLPKDKVKIGFRIDKLF